MDNQNNQNGYTNFNGYQPSPNPTQQPIQQQPVQQQPVQQPYQQPYQQIPYNPYQVPLQQETKHKSIVLGILAIVLPIIGMKLGGLLPFVVHINIENERKFHDVVFGFHSYHTRCMKLEVDTS